MNTCVHVPCCNRTHISCYGVKVRKCQRQESLIKQVVFQQVRWGGIAEAEVPTWAKRRWESMEADQGVQNRTADLEAGPT